MMLKNQTLYLFVTCIIAVILFISPLSGCKKNAEIVVEPELVIKLERTVCFGKCPAYSLTIKGDGSVIYEGKDNVRITGIQEATVESMIISRLLEEFEDADYYSLKDSYTGFGKSDMPTVYTSISLGDHTKSVRHYLGDNSAPAKLTSLENKIDEIVNSAQWIK